MYSRLFEPFEVGGLKLRNRLTMAPTYLGYAGEGGMVSNLLLDHYRLMAGSGVAMVVVENVGVELQVHAIHQPKRLELVLGQLARKRRATCPRNSAARSAMKVLSNSS